MRAKSPGLILLPEPFIISLYNKNLVLTKPQTPNQIIKNKTLIHLKIPKRKNVIKLKKSPLFKTWEKHTISLAKVKAEVKINQKIINQFKRVTPIAI